MSNWKPFIFLIVISILQSCSSTHYVKIHHIFEDNLELRQQYEGIGQIYLLLKDSSSSYIPAASFARKLNEELKKIGGSIAAYRVVNHNSKKDLFTYYIKPSAVLRIDIGKFKYNDYKTKLKNRYQQPTETSNNKNYNEEVWVVNAEFNVDLTYYTLESKNSTIKDSFTVRVKRTESSEPDDDDKSNYIDDLYEHTVRKVARRLLPRTVTRERLALRTDKDKKSIKAFKNSKRGQFDSAEMIWKERIDSNNGNWKDYFDLGIISEVRRDFETARSYYEEAQKLALDSKQAQKIDWTQIFSDLDKSIPIQITENTSNTNLFLRTVAILPFSDATVSIDGPEMLRRLTYEYFKNNGYSVIPLEEIDNVLRKNGFTQGGQLRAADHLQIAEWLNADWLFYGDISEFNKINVGIYVNSKIEGNLWIWEREDEDELWSSDIPVSFSSLPEKFDWSSICSHFISNLAESFIENIQEKPLYHESLVFIDRNLRTLPRKVK